MISCSWVVYAQDKCTQRDATKQHSGFYFVPKFNLLPDTTEENIKCNKSKGNKCIFTVCLLVLQFKNSPMLTD